MGGVPVFGPTVGNGGSGGGSEGSAGGVPGWSGGGVGVEGAGEGVAVGASGVAVVVGCDVGSGGTGVATTGGGGGVATRPVPPVVPPELVRTVGTGVDAVEPRSCASEIRSRVGVGVGLPVVAFVVGCATVSVACVAPAVGASVPVTLAFELTCGASAVGTAGSVAPLVPTPPQYANAPAPSTHPARAIIDRFIP